jgi:predicted RNA binding protein YcfA (HicA-like mRNA interferase family)
LQQTGAHRLHHRPHRLTVVVGGHGNQDVHLANVDQLTDKVIRKYACFGQSSS